MRLALEHGVVDDEFEGHRKVTQLTEYPHGVVVAAGDRR